MRVLSGLGYGLLLAGLSLIAAGAGHGTYIPVAISAAPTAWFGVLPGLIAAPLLWCAVAALVVDAPAALRLARLALVGHYAGAVWLVTTEPVSGRGSHPLANPAWLVAWVSVYVAGQVVIWAAIRRRRRSNAATG